jgi:hypothetical protein
MHGLLGQQQQKGSAYIAALRSPAPCATGTTAACPCLIDRVRLSGKVGMMASPAVLTAGGQAVAVTM